ncbi:hypothetical protein Scani_03000 [Streptomyces caniferus]|uniref:Uncharacterized protein n=1 Tax=Streptomyces caniferus TaxID=285557 RepID=A0A640S037_9ACTN|nr:hypothetical protein [Streptomyces caniferus]GFE04032.1 hypothetical protein Scani_03000 [Streptomyces caniferus]
MTAPRFKKTFTTAEFADVCGLDDLRHLTARPGVDLDAALGRPHPLLIDLDRPQDTDSLQHALYFPQDDAETPVAFYVLSRIAPTLRHIGWLPDLVRLKSRTIRTAPGTGQASASSREGRHPQSSEPGFSATRL